MPLFQGKVLECALHFRVRQTGDKYYSRNSATPEIILLASNNIHVSEKRGKTESDEGSGTKQEKRCWLRGKNVSSTKSSLKASTPRGGVASVGLFGERPSALR